MKKSREVLCMACQEPIERLDDLDVVSIGYMIGSYHSRCFQEKKKRLIFRNSWKINGAGFWVFLVLMNLTLAAMLVIWPDSWRDLRWFFLVFNGLMLVARLFSFFAYEMPLWDA